MRRQFLALATAAAMGVALLSSATAHAGPITDSFTTIFGQIPGPTPSLAPPGSLAADVGSFPSASVLGSLGNFTDFSVQNLAIDLLGGSSNTGQILFFQSGGPTGFYVGGGGPATGNDLTPQGLANLGGPQVNNRAYGVFGTGRSDFVFAPGAVTSIDLQVRGTNSGSSIGSNPDLGQSLPENSPLADASPTVLVYTDLGLQSTVSGINLADFQTISLDISSLPGDFITRVSLVNEGPVNSAIVLGELTVGTEGINPNGFPVPEPTSLALLGLSAGLAGVRRRR